MVAMVGFVGLAVDGGRLYSTKTELQNAADACALAAARELTDAPNIGAGSFVRADAFAQQVASLNKVGFQGAAINPADVSVTYSPTLGGSWSGSGSASPSSAYARCTITKTGIQPALMQVLGIGDQTVSAMATASLAPSMSSCAIPMAVCVQPGAGAPEYGYVRGNWYGLDFEDSGGPNATVNNYTGNFRWVDFNPGAATPGCSGGGARELACIMRGYGECKLPKPNLGPCASNGNATPTPGCVGQNGNIGSMEASYNSRFGVYKGGGGQPQAADSPPDYSGFSYDLGNWGPGRDAYSGADPGSGNPNFRDSRAARRPTENYTGMPNPEFVSAPYSASSTADHSSFGADRRLVVVPIVECGSFVSGQHAPVRAYACMLLLDPYRKVGNSVVSKFEYLGLANAPGSPCATTGVAGDANATGPRVPALVQ